MYPTICFFQVLGQLYGQSVGSTAIQISGNGTTAYAPSSERQGIFVANPANSTQTIYVSPSSSVLGTGDHAVWTLLPGQERYLACKGSFPLWVVAAGASGGLYTIVEVQ